MDIGKSFSYPFEDDQWTSKALIGAVVNIIPIVNFAGGGYFIDLLKNVINGAPKPLPEWSDFGDKWVKGFMVFLAGLIYSLPVIILGCIPLVLLGGIAAFQGDTGDALERFWGLFAGVGGLFACLIAIYALALSFYYPAACIHYARTGNFGAFFQIGEINKVITKDVGNYLIVWGIVILASFVIGLIGGAVSLLFSVIPCIGQILSWLVSAVIGVYALFVYGHLFGQVAAAPGATSLTVPPPGDITQ